MLSGCFGAIKYLMVLINFIFWLWGFAIVILSIWMLTDPTFYFSMTQEENNYYISLYILLAVGALMLLVAFLGCCGAFKESQCMLISFFSFMLIILVAEVAAGVWAYTNFDGLELTIRKAVKTTVQEEYGEVQSRTITFDVIQKELQCCGAEGPSDWNNSKYNKKNSKLGSLGFQVTSLMMIYNIPQSCCHKDVPISACETASKIGAGGVISQVIYSQGCMDKFVDTIKSHCTTVTAVIIGIVAIEVLGILFALILCFAINRSDRYKA